MLWRGRPVREYIATSTCDCASFSGDDGEQILVHEDVVQSDSLPVELGARPLDSGVAELADEVAV